MLELLHYNGPEKMAKALVIIMFDNSEGKCTAPGYQKCQEISVMRQMTSLERNRCWINAIAVPNDSIFFNSFKMAFVTSEEIDKLLFKEPADVSIG